MMKLCLKYLTHVQKSVFEGDIKESQIAQLKSDIKKIINVKEDSCIIYNIGNTRYCKKEKLGVNVNTSDILCINK